MSDDLLIMMDIEITPDIVVICIEYLMWVSECVCMRTCIQLDDEHICIVLD